MAVSIDLNSSEATPFRIAWARTLLEFKDPLSILTKVDVSLSGKDRLVKIGCLNLYIVLPDKCAARQQIGVRRNVYHIAEL